MLAFLLGILGILAFAAEPKIIHPVPWLGDMACADSVAFLGTSGKIVVLAIPDGRVAGELVFPGPVQALAWDGRGLLAAGGWNTVRVWRWPEGELLWEDAGTSTLIRGLAFTDSGLLLGGGANGLVFAWDLEGRRVWARQAHPGPVWGIAASPKGPVFATAGSDRLAVWDLETTGEIQTFPGRAWDAAFSPDGFLLAAGIGKILKVWDTALWLSLWEVWAHESCTVTVAFSPDGTLLATGSLDQTAKVWDAGTGRLVFALPPFPAILAAVRFGPFGLLAGSEDGTLALWQP
ncbi:MAG: WD40 repeat domain-containing protein [Candidatus Bipolaricaulaceae bacterium]